MEYIFLMGADWRVSTSFSFFRSSTYVKILIPLAHHVHRSTWFYQDRENPCKSEKDKASNLLEVDDYTCFHVLVPVSNSFCRLKYLVYWVRFRTSFSVIFVSLSRIFMISIRHATSSSTLKAPENGILK